eukprot:c8178_g1_i1.p1 GENE.c8178_g1_i1~~c8178_g1_i1.p1  ORF type:complete len:715 (+),score=168.45 c8178_g1_i1:36-2180(+)
MRTRFEDRTLLLSNLCHILIPIQHIITLVTLALMIGTQAHDLWGIWISVIVMCLSWIITWVHVGLFIVYHLPLPTALMTLFAVFGYALIPIFDAFLAIHLIINPRLVRSMPVILQGYTDSRMFVHNALVAFPQTLICLILIVRLIVWHDPHDSHRVFEVLIVLGSTTVVSSILALLLISSQRRHIPVGYVRCLTALGIGCPPATYVVRLARNDSGPLLHCPLESGGVEILAHVLPTSRSITLLDATQFGSELRVVSDIPKVFDRIQNYLFHLTSTIIPLNEQDVAVLGTAVSKNIGLKQIKLSDELIDLELLNSEDNIEALLRDKTLSLTIRTRGGVVSEPYSIADFQLTALEVPFLISLLTHGGTPSVTSLRVENAPFGSVSKMILPTISSRLFKIRELYIDSCDLTDADSSTLSEALTWSSLRTLSLTNNQIGDIGACTLADAMPLISQVLEKFDLLGNSKITSLSGEPLSFCVIGLKKSLQFFGAIPVNDLHMGRIHHAAFGVESDSSQKVRSPPQQQHHIEVRSKLRPRASKETIEFRNFSTPTILESFEAIVLFSLIHESPGLKGIELSHTTIDILCADKLASALQSNTTRLTALHLTDAALSPQAFRVICAALTSNEALSELSLVSCSLGDHSISVLSDLLTANRGLTKLNLSDNGITDFGAVKLASALTTNPTVTTVVMRQNNLTIQGKAVLEQCRKALSPVAFTFD